MKTAVCIISVSRPEQTIFHTIETMRKRSTDSPDFVAISVGDPNSSYVESIENVTLLRTTQHEWEDWGGASVHKGYLLTRNSLRALRWLAKTGADLCLFAEDDIEFDFDWLKRVKVIAEQSPSNVWGLCCSSAHPEWCFGKATQVGSDAFARFTDPGLFWGTQLMAYPRAGAAGMASHVQKCISSWKNVSTKLPRENWLAFGDQAVKTYFLENQIPLYVTLPSLARHTGRFNTWNPKGGESHAYRDHPTRRFQQKAK